MTCQILCYVEHRDVFIELANNLTLPQAQVELSKYNDLSGRKLFIEKEGV